VTEIIPPLIGITTEGRWQDHFQLRIEYVDAVRRAGGIPVLLPPGESHLEALLERLDGIIFSGGGDISPALYQGQTQHPTLSPIDPERDAFEIALAQILLTRRMPMLYVCRGIQLLNVALGGTLMEHLPDEVDGRVTHRLSADEYLTHPLSIEPHSRLAGILAQTEITPISWHHQAVRQLAPGLTVVARAADGIIEAVEMPEVPWLMAVQWHPEMSSATDPAQHNLFEWLVKEAVDYRDAAI
jgi:putative glutamine amidotransferase